MNLTIFESLPVTILFFAVVTLMMVFNEIGYQYAMHARDRKDKEASASLGPMVGGLLGMLAFVLAFTFSIASSQHELRKQNVIEEANAIGTAYLRTDLIDIKYATEVKRLLRVYVDIRLKAAKTGEIDSSIDRWVEIHDLLWMHVSSAAKEHPSTNTSLMIQFANEVIDMHEKRVMGGTA